MSDTKSLEITPVIYPSVELKTLLQEAINESKINMVIKKPALPTDIGLGDLALTVLLDIKPSDKKAILKEKFEKINSQLMEAIDIQIDALPGNIAAAFYAIVFKIVFELIDQLIAPYDQYIVDIQQTWNRVVRLFRKLSDPNLKNELKDECRNQLIEILTYLMNTTPFVAEVIALIMLIDTMKSTIKTLRDAKSVSAEECMSTEEKMRNMELILNQEALLKSELITTIIYVISLILPLVSILCAIFATGRKCDQEMAGAAQKQMEEDYNNRPIIKQKYTSEIQEFAKNEQNGFSYIRKRKNSRRGSSANKQKIPFGSDYRKLTTIDGETTWVSDNLPNIKTLSETPLCSISLNGVGFGFEQLGQIPESDFIECVYEDGTAYGVIYDSETGLGLRIVDKDPDFCHTDIDFDNICQEAGVFPALPVDDENKNKKSNDEVLSDNIDDLDSPKRKNGDDSGDDEGPDEDDDVDGILNIPIGDGDGNADGDEDGTNYINDNVRVVGAFIEYEKTIPVTKLYSEGGSISGGDTIALLGSQKVISQCSGQNASTDKNVTVVSYPVETASSMSNQIERMCDMVASSTDMKSEMDAIVERFNKLSNAKMVLKDYMIPMQLPFIPAGMTNSRKPKASKDSIYESLMTFFNAIREKYEDDIQSVTGKENVENRLNAGDMDGLKNEIMSVNNVFYSSIINTFETYLNQMSRMCDESEIESYSLLSDYALIYESIVHNDNNPYLLELEYLLKRFISERSALEELTKAEAIIAMDSLCNMILVPHWTYTKSYYEVFEEVCYNSEIHQGDIEVKYKPLYDFLAGLIGFTEKTQKEVEFTSLEDLQNSDSTETALNEADEAIKNLLKKICTRFFIAREIQDTTQQESYSDSQRAERLRSQCTNEMYLVQEYFNKVKQAYYDGLTVLDDSTYDVFKQASVRRMQNVFYNGMEYEHYYVTPGGEDGNDIPILDDRGKELANYEASAYTSKPPYSFPYWLLYCMQATLVHCMLPMYWPCGLLVMGAPLPLPVIYIPIYYMGGDVGILFGLGICGMFIWPMMVFVNYNLDPRTILPPINMIVSMIRKMVDKMTETMKGSLKGFAKMKMDSIKNSSDSYKDQLEQLDIELSDAKEEMIGLGRARKERRKLKKEQKKKQKTQSQ